MKKLPSYISNFTAAIYFAFINPVLLKNIDGTFVTVRESSYSFGMILLLLLAFETYALPKRIRQATRSINSFRKSKGVKQNKGKEEDQEITGIILWVFHFMVSFMVTFTAFSAFGYNYEEMMKSTAMFSIAVLVIMFRELYFLFAIIDPCEEDHKKQKGKTNRGWGIEAMLLIYSLVAMTLTWGSATQGSIIQQESLSYQIGERIVAAVLFLLFYSPLRIPYFIENFGTADNTSKLSKRLIGPIFIATLAVINM